MIPQLPAVLLLLQAAISVHTETAGGPRHRARRPRSSSERTEPERAVGHLADTTLPVESGNVVLGHRDTFFRPFKRRIEMFTTLLCDGTLFYVLAVAPRDRVSDYAGTFRRVVGSIQIMDSDRCVRE